MFRRLSAPLPLSEASLLALRPALNAPVVNVGFLPVGPARAALVVFAEEYGGIGIAFGIRSVEGGQVAVLGNQESIDETAALSEALEPALAEAERMGFVFDEDMLAHPVAGDRASAMSVWAGLMGEIGTPAASVAGPSASAPEPPPEPLAELVLEEVAPVELTDLDHEIEEIELDLEASSGSPSEGSRPLSLSKFRHVATAGEEALEASPRPSQAPGSGSELGRIALKRVVGGPDGALRRIPYLARLLSSF